MAQWKDLKSKVRHGTPSGHRKHLAEDTKPCDACVRAKSAYDKRLSEAGNNTRRNRVRARAQVAAYQMLAKKHPEEYKKYYEALKFKLFTEAGLSYKYDPIPDDDDRGEADD